MTQAVTTSSGLPSRDDLPLARRLREARIEEGITVKDLAQKLGVEPRTVARWMAKSRPRRPSYERLVEIAQILNKPISFFLEADQPQ